MDVCVYTLRLIVHCLFVVVVAVVVFVQTNITVVGVYFIHANMSDSFVNAEKLQLYKSYINSRDRSFNEYVNVRSIYC